MALVFADRVKVRSNSTGTGNFTLRDVVFGFQTFNAIGNGNECYYGIVDGIGNWEIGQGTYTAPDTLSRDTVFSSSNSNNLVDFPDGSKNVFTTFPAELAAGFSSAGDPFKFKTITVFGENDITADSTTDTLTLVAGDNITITTDNLTDSITFNSTSGSSFDQDLNTTDDVEFNSVTSASLVLQPSGSITLSEGFYINETDISIYGLTVAYTSQLQDAYASTLRGGTIDTPASLDFYGNVDFTNATVTGISGGSFDQDLNTTDDVTFGTLSATGVVAGVIGGFDDTPLNIETYAIDGESTVVNSWLFGTDGTITFPDSTVQTTAYTGSGDNPFDQDLNTSDAVTFASVNSSLFAAESNNQDLVIQTNEATFEGGVAEETATNANAVGNNYFSAVIASFPTITNVQAGWTANGLDLEVDSEVLSVSNDGTFFQIEINVSNGTFAFGESYTFTEPTVTTVTSKTWTFGYDNGSLEFPGGAVLDTQGPLSNSDFNITIPGEFALEPQTFSFTDEGGSGALKFPDGTYQYTAFSGGSPTELNDETNGNKLIIDADGDIVLTDASGTLETPSGGGSNRGLVWDYGEANGGSNSHILEQSGEGDLLEIRAFVTSEIQAPIRLTVGSLGNPKVLDWTAEGKLQRNEDFLLSVAPGDSTESIWNFGTDGNTNIPGALVFPDGTQQTTAYVTDASTSLWVVANVDGTVAFSEDAVTWTSGLQLTINGVSTGDAVGDVGRVTVGPTNIVYTIEGILYYSVGQSTALTACTVPEAAEADPENDVNPSLQFRNLEYGGGYYVAVGGYYTDNNNDVPVFYYSIDGVTWTQGSVDSGYAANVGFNFRDVNYDGTGWFISGDGGFYITSITDTLDESNYTSIVSPGNIAPDYIAFNGQRWVAEDAGIYYFAPIGDPLGGDWTAVDPTDAGAADEIFGRWNGPGEFAAGEINGEYWVASVNGDGQVIATKDAGATWVGSAPKASYGIIGSVESDSTSTIIGLSDYVPAEAAGNSDGPGDPSEGDKVVITGATGATQLNGTYYLEESSNGAGPSNYILWQDREFTVGVDSTAWAGLYDTDSATITFIKGTYIDSFTYGDGKFLVGNDDEELYSSTDLVNWTLVDTKGVGQFAYWNDIDYYADTTSVTPSNRLVAGNKTALLSTDGTLNLPGALVLPTDYPLDGTIEAKTALDLTKSVQVLIGTEQDGLYTLADGREGQIMHFAWLTNGIYVQVANARIYNSGTSAVEIVNDYSWAITAYGDGEEPRTIAMAIFVDGAWNLLGGSTD